MYVRSVSILLPYNSKGEVLLQHRSSEAVYYPGYWGFFGGGIESGETPEKALKREIMEELEINIDSARFFKRYEIEEEKGVYERFLYLLPINISFKRLKSQLREGDGIGFFSLDEVNKLKINPYTRFIFDEVKRYLWVTGVLHA